MAKRLRKNSQVCEPVKKFKIESISLKNYSFSLTSCFGYLDSLHKAFFYSFPKCRLFGVLLPVRYPDNMELEFIKIIELDNEMISQIRVFQNTMWKDMFKIKRDTPVAPTEANYLVVPVSRYQKDVIDFEIIKQSASAHKLLSDIPSHLRNNLILISKSNNTWKYLDVVSNDIPTFFKQLYGDYKELQRIIEIYKDCAVEDLIFNQLNDCQAITGLRKSLESHLKPSELVFVKHTKSIKTPNSSSGSSYYPIGTPIIPISTLKVFYLSSDHWDQGHTLLNSLMELEFLSYTYDFSLKISYKGDLMYLKQAMTSSEVNQVLNYEPLETLGDSIIKFLSTLELYIEFPSNSENKSTKIRSSKVSNKNLSVIAKKLDFGMYIKTKGLNVSDFRPAYYSCKASVYEKSEILQEISEKSLADFLEAIVGAFYITQGLVETGKFLMRIGFIDTKNWKEIKDYLTEQHIGVLNKSDTINYTHKPYKIKDLYSKLPNTTDSVLKKGFLHNFYDTELFTKAFTHSSVSICNYEALEFLGDSVLDIIIMCNIYPLYSFSCYELSELKTLLVCNQNLCCISIYTELSNFLSIKPSLNTFNCDDIKIESIDPMRDDIFNLNLPKHFGDIVESFIGAVLIDTKSLIQTAQIIGNWMKKQILYSVMNIHTHLSTLKPLIAENKKVSIKI